MQLLFESLVLFRQPFHFLFQFFDLVFGSHCFWHGSGLLKSTIDGFLQDEVFYVYGEGRAEDKPVPAARGAW